MKDAKSQVWAYLHDELPKEERERFEQILASDAELRDALEACRATHEELQRMGDRLLEEQLLAEWEAEHPEYGEPDVRSRARILRFSIPLAAAAAAAFLLLALPHNKGPVRWKRTVYGSAPQLRDQSAALPFYSRATLKQAVRELQDAVETIIAERPVTPKPWTLGIHLQELNHGTLAVEVSGHPANHPEQAETWNETYDGLDGFRAGIPAMAERLIEHLAPRNLP